ncbi:MAG: DUF427 domain-containing protein [Spirochaetota bacterium]
MSEKKAHYATIERSEDNYQVTYNQEVILQSKQVLLVHEHYSGKDYPPVVYFPQSAIDSLETSPTELSTKCPIKGNASYLTYKEAESGIWTYADPKPDLQQLKGYYAFAQQKGFRVSKVTD